MGAGRAGRNVVEPLQRALDDRPGPWAKVQQRADPEAIKHTLAFLDDALNKIAAGNRVQHFANPSC
jgi:hypothetical protein